MSFVGWCSSSAVGLIEGESVFLDEAYTVKLGDFGLSKALAQASFANTYVGVSTCLLAFFAHSFYMRLLC